MKHHIKIDGKYHGARSKVYLDGVDISSSLRAITLHWEVGKATTVTYEFLPESFEAETEAHGEPT